MKKYQTKIAILVAILAISLSSCMSLSHQVGSGSQGNSKETKRQWYIIYGLVPINKVDSKQMSNNATNYTVKSEITPVDFVLNIFTSIVTVYSQTVTVTK
jgi:hypothetical protein